MPSMIDPYGHPLLSSCVTTLKETSRDDSKEDVCYMTESSLPVIDFDAVKDGYIKNLKLKGETPKSNDALFLDSIVGEVSGSATFIEFKNGVIEGGKKRDLFTKIFDSLLMLADMNDIHLSRTRETMDYILVYNQNTNKKSESRAAIAKATAKQAKSEFVQFGLKRFEGFYFRNVFTYTQDEFEKFFVKPKERILKRRNRNDDGTTS